MNSQQKRNRKICKHCNHVFDYEDAVIKYRDIGSGVKIPEKKCPLCGWDFKSIEVPEYLDKYLFCDNDNRYYDYK